MKRGDVDGHEKRIESLLARKAAERAARGCQAEAVTGYTPLAALIKAEDGDDDEHTQAARSEILALMIDYTMQDGPHPANVLKNFYAVVHALRPDAMPDWSCRDFAELFGEGRAAHSWRVKKIFGRVLKARGARPIKARFQKSEASIPKFAAAQKGNRNRRHGFGRADDLAA